MWLPSSCAGAHADAVLMLGRYAEALEGVRAALRCSYRSSAEEKNAR